MGVPQFAIPAVAAAPLENKKTGLEGPVWCCEVYA